MASHSFQAKDSAARSKALRFQTEAEGRAPSSFVSVGILLRFVALLPANLAYAIAVLLGNLEYQFNRTNREDLSRTLAYLLGNYLPVTDRVRVTKECFRMRYCELLDIFLLEQKPRELFPLIRIHGREHLDAALAEGGGAVLVSGHLGSIKVGLAALGAEGYPVTVIARWLIPEYRGRTLRRLVAKSLLGIKSMSSYYGHPNIYVKSDNLVSAFRAVGLLRENEFVVVLIDSVVLPGEERTAASVRFLGRNVLLRIGAVAIARAARSPLLPIFMHREGDYRHQVLEVFPPVPLSGQDVDTFNWCLRMVENQILRYPSHFAKWREEGLR